MISGSLSAVAGLCGEHTVYLLDENVEEIDWEALRAYDIVGVTGMNVQKQRMREILLRLQELDVFTVVGGPFVSVQEAFFEGLCDARFVGSQKLLGLSFWRTLPAEIRRRNATNSQSRPT